MQASCFRQNLISKFICEQAPGGNPKQGAAAAGEAKKVEPPPTQLSADELYKRLPCCVAVPV